MKVRYKKKVVMILLKIFKYLKIPWILIRIIKLFPYKILKKTHNALISPFYHTVESNHIPTKYLFDNPDKQKFKNDLFFLLKEYRSISLKKIMDLNKGGEIITNPSFHLTFDDGYSDNYDIAMTFLKKNKIHATFFIVKDFLDNKNMFFRNKASLIINELSINENEKMQKVVHDYLKSIDLVSENINKSLLSIKYADQKHLNKIAKLCKIDFDEYLQNNKPYMTSSQINDLIECGFSIGAHSIDHPLLQEMNETDQIYQVTKSMGFIQENFNLQYKAFAAPFNDEGLKKSLIEKLIEEKHIDIFFGTQDFRDDYTPKSHPRLSMDGNNANLMIKTIFKNSLSSSFILRLMGENDVQR